MNEFFTCGICGVEHRALVCDNCGFYFCFLFYGKFCPKCGRDLGYNFNEFKTMKLTLIQNRPYEFLNLAGETIIGSVYAGFASDNRVVEFSSQEEHEIFGGEISFNPQHCEEIEIVAKVFQGKVKYAEKK